MTDRLVRQRAFLFQCVVLLSFVVLAVQLWRIQILEGSKYRLQSEQNSVAFQTIDAPRGVIYDRQGQILVRNRPLYRATLQPALLLNETYLLWTPSDYAKVGNTLTARR